MFFIYWSLISSLQIILSYYVLRHRERKNLENHKVAKMKFMKIDTSERNILEFMWG
jgi:hypothetical protein